jgi:hypothetical protein
MKQPTYTTLVAFVVCALATFLPGHSLRAAEQDQSEPGLLSDGKLNLSFRYRYELVDQEGFAKDAHASTLRTRLTYQSPFYSDFGFLVEFDDVRVVGNDLYNSTRNGNTNRPVVADPEGTEVNQALVTYKGFENTLIRAGRRRIKLDNDRFIGNVGWRQNAQTYDSLSISNLSLPNTTIEYAYIGNVNRIFGPNDGTPPANYDSDSHILNAKYSMWPNLDITAYAYLLDLENAPAASNRTLGIRVVGSNVVNDRISIGYTIEYADQGDYGDNPNDYSADYILLEGVLTTGGVTAKLGYEVLGGGAVQAFQTPLATLHAFQGWADKFLATPTGGIEDLYVSVAKKYRGTSYSVVYHRFDPETGGPNYGSEWDLVVKRPFAERYSIGLKYANYNASSHATDTQKLWVMFGAKFGN